MNTSSSTPSGMSGERASSTTAKTITDETMTRSWSGVEMPYWHTAHDAWPEVVCLDRGDPRTPLAVGCRLAPMAACPACGHEYEGGRSSAWSAPRPSPPPPVARGGAEGRQCPVLRPGRVHGRSEQADPEDVDRMLSAYAEMARARIEAHGGVVEKFIGDAVVGVFGVPAAHEDDPERAVRAGLADRRGCGGARRDRR